MLSAQSFMTGMEMLKKCYIGWQFDTKDEMQVNLWYSVFKSTTDEQFMSIVKEYIARNDYPPKCIKNLTDILVDKALLQAKIPPEKALHFVRDNKRLRRLGIRWKDRYIQKARKVPCVI